IRRPNSTNWYYLFQIQGRKYFGSTQTPKKTLAVKIEAKLREDAISRLVLGETEPISLNDALKRYKRSKEGTPNYKNVVGYANKLLGFKTEPKTGQKLELSRLVSPNTAIHEITDKDIKALVTARKGEKASHWTIKHELQTLRGAIYLVRDLGYHINLDLTWPTKDLKTKRGRLRFLTKEEELRLLTELDPNRGGRGLAPVDKRLQRQLHHMQDNYDFVIALLDTGMRYDEMAKLPWSAVDISTGIIRIYRNKVDLADTFHMTDRLKGVLEKRFHNRRPGARYVFESANGGPRGYTAQGIRKAIDRAELNDPDVVREKGGKVTIHTLRHTFASRLVQAGISLAKV
ncbi:MAG: site-specific integrase, partial [Nitrososphaera sp.]|nr:site-specific integrase [Nitrososphaera sp.]